MAIKIKQNNNRPVASTQSHLDIEDIQDDLVIQKSGGVSLILETNAVNFSLLSEIEQDSKINAFSGLLNSINYNLQILIHTESVDISRYITTLEEYMNKQENSNIKNQIQNYMEFIKNLIKRNDVLDKRFYVIIPYVSYNVHKTSSLRQIFGKEERILDINKLLENAKKDLYPKKDGVAKLLLRMGLKSKQLSSQELVQLFYKLYNTDSPALPKTSFSIDDFTAPVVGSNYSFENDDDSSKIFENNLQKI